MHWVTCEDSRRVEVRNFGSLFKVKNPSPTNFLQEVNEKSKEVFSNSRVSKNFFEYILTNKESF